MATVSDLHPWRVGPGDAALVASLVTDQPHDPSIYRLRLKGLKGLSHVTVEVHTCPDPEHPHGPRRLPE